jgi:hypothetical protein
MYFSSHYYSFCVFAKRSFHVVEHHQSEALSGARFFTVGVEPQVFRRAPSAASKDDIADGARLAWTHLEDVSFRLCIYRFSLPDKYACVRDLFPVKK